MQQVARLYELYGPRVYSYLLHLSGDHDLAAELTQETFCRLLTAVVTYRGDANVLTWIIGIARNVYRDELKRRAKSGGTAKAEVLETVLSPDGNPVEALMNEEKRIEVSGVLAELPSTYREVLFLKEYEGVDYDTIAAMMGRVEAHLQSCSDCRRVRDALGTQGRDDTMPTYDAAEGAAELARRLRKTVVGVLAGIVAVALVIAVGFFFLGARSTRFPPVTAKEARGLVAEAVDRTLKGDFQGLCGLSEDPARCNETYLGNGLQDRAPTKAPSIVCVYEVPEQSEANGNLLAGGQVVVVSGVDGTGKPFGSDLTVFKYAGGMKPVLHDPVWWDGNHRAVTDPNRAKNCGAQ